MVAGIKIYLIFKGIPASPALRLRFARRPSPFIRTSKIEQSVLTALFFCAGAATIFTFPPNLPLTKGGYKLGERLFKSFVFLYL